MICDLTTVLWFVTSFRESIESTLFHGRMTATTGSTAGSTMAAGSVTRSPAGVGSTAGSTAGVGDISRWWQKKISPPIRMDIEQIKSGSEFDAWVASWKNFAVVSGLSWENAETQLRALICNFELSTMAMLNAWGVDVDKLGEWDSANLLQLLRKTVVREPNVAVARWFFRSRIQEQGESVIEFLLALRTLAVACHLNSMSWREH